MSFIGSPRSTACLPPPNIMNVSNLEQINTTADPYTELKQRLCRAYGRSEMQKVNDLLDLPNLGSEKPSVLMDNILSLWPDTSTRNSSKLLLGLFLRRLPLPRICQSPLPGSGQALHCQGGVPQAGASRYHLQVRQSMGIPPAHGEEV